TYNLEDQIGSSTVRLNTTGAVIDKEEFYPFGDSSLRTFTKKRYRYVGKEKDLESGLYYYGARYYAPWLCRFISVDPMKEERAWLTPYNYVQNNPINLTDPTGALDDGGGDPVKKGDTFVGDDGKTHTASIDEVEITAVAPETLQSNAEKTYWNLRESQGGNPKMSEWDFSDSQESQLYHENGSLTGLGQLVNNIGIQQHYLETRTKDGAAGKFFESAFKEGGLNNFEIGELSQMRAEVVKSVKAQYLAGIFSEENLGVVLGLSLFSASAGLRETGKRTIQSIAPKAAEATEATTTALARRANPLSYHGEFERFALRGVSPKMAQKAIEKGSMFYDPKNKSINYILRNGFASGKDLLVGTNPLSGKITTVIRGRNLASKRMIPIQ
nr:RHS repeat-associated core domain-containing protein [Flavobacteriales bacterium]